MRNAFWCFMAVLPVCGTVALVLAVKSNADISYGFIFFLAMLGWFIITVYSSYRFTKFITALKDKLKDADNSGREKYFAALESAYDIRDRLRLLEKDIRRNIERIHSMGEEKGFCNDRTNKSGTT